MDGIMQSQRSRMPTNARAPRRFLGHESIFIAFYSTTDPMGPAAGTPDPRTPVIHACAVPVPWGHRPTKKFTSTQLRYDTYEEELMGIYSAIIHFKPYLLTRPFIVHTDNRNLTFLLKSTTPKHQRWLLALQEFDSTIHHVAGLTLRTTLPGFEPPNYMTCTFRPLTNTSAFSPYR